MTGYIKIPNIGLWMPYIYKDTELTIYSKNSLPLESIKLKSNIEFNSEIAYLIGNNTETNETVIFFVESIPYEDRQFFWDTSSTHVLYYIVLYRDILQFDEVSFKFSELNYFYSTYYGINKEVSTSNTSMSIQTIPFEKNDEEFVFQIQGKEISCKLGVTQTIHIKSRTPITLDSTLICKFQQTNNINLLLDLYYTIQEFFHFICYRKNIEISVQLSGVDSESKRLIAGDLYILNDIGYQESDETIAKTIEYGFIKNKISELIQLISDGKLYSEHIPNSKKDANIITTARFILITAAFEWNVNNYFKIPLSKMRLKVKNDVLESILKIPEEKGYNSKLKSKLKFYKDLVSNVEVNLSERIVFALKEFQEILKPFINNLYGINELQVDAFEKMGDRIQNQRNAYAHGDIAKKFDSMVILDIIILEWINYCIVLKSIGYQNDEIFNIIKKIFDKKSVSK